MAENHLPGSGGTSQVQGSRENTEGEMFTPMPPIYLHAHFRKISFVSNHGAVLSLQDSGRPTGSLSRDFTLSRVVFSCMQGVASTPIHKAFKKPQCQTNGVQNTSRSSRFQQFHQVKSDIHTFNFT